MGKSIGTRWIALYMNGNNEISSHDAVYLIAFELNIFQKKLLNS